MIAPLVGFFRPPATLDSNDPSIPNLPLESPSAANAMPQVLPPAIILLPSTEVRQPARHAWAFWQNPVGGAVASYLWRVAGLGGTALAVAACAVPEVRQPTAQAWPFGRTAPAVQAQPFHAWSRPAVQRLEAEGFGQPAAVTWPFGTTAAPDLTANAMPQVLPAAIVLLPSTEVRQPGRYAWPHWQNPAAPVNAQPFNLWTRPPVGRIEPEGFGQPKAHRWQFGRNPRHIQPLLTWAFKGQPRIEPEVVRQPSRYAWQFGRNPRHIQPLLTWASKGPARVEPEAVRQPARYAWPFGRSYPAVGASQPFNMWTPLTRVRIEPEAVRQPGRYAWPFGRTYSPVPYHFPVHAWRVRAPSRIESEAVRAPGRYAWAFYRNPAAAASQPFNIWTPAARVRIEPEAVRAPGRYAWPFGLTPRHIQPLLTWASKAPTRIEPETVRAPGRHTWAFYGLAPSQPFHIWITRRPAAMLEAPFALPAVMPSWPFGSSYAVPVLVGSHLVVYPCTDRDVDPCAPRDVEPVAERAVVPGLARTVRPKR